jgi:hypothetical protein
MTHHAANVLFGLLFGLGLAFAFAVNAIGFYG